MTCFLKHCFFRDAYFAKYFVMFFLEKKCSLNKTFYFFKNTVFFFFFEKQHVMFKVDYKQCLFLQKKHHKKTPVFMVEKEKKKILLENCKCFDKKKIR